ncbi:RHS repeat domain-containing protein, partial [Apibacter mensalis]|uniref:RHS repeat domain-containing protein n=1 Tax=Apibacter mensalis TaxID=1586267 RepID=UPI0026ED2A0E
PDHLGSSRYITNLDGEIVQHVEYVPFGEVFIEERNNSWNTPYLFNGKELDEETGLYYYGARYYNPRESVWLSVDPMFEKTMTPYQYTYQNPVKFIDPTGMKGENTNEPPIKGIAYFSDDTGQYFWNHNKDSYEHYATGQDGYSYYEGMYTVDESKGPVGDYTIHLEGGKPGELAKKYIVKVTKYEEMSMESIDNRFSIDFEISEIISTKVFAREKGSVDTNRHTNNYKVPAKILNGMIGL